MTKNLYYRSVFRRENKYLSGILEFFLAICSFPRMLIEVFIRKNFGERYFSYGIAIIITVMLLFYPVIVSSIHSFFTGFKTGGTPTFPNSQMPNLPFNIDPKSLPYGADHYGRTQNETSSPTDSKTQYITWYIFTLGFIWASFRRHEELKRNPSVFDFARFSLYTGDIHPFFYNLKMAKGNIRNIEIFYEPLGFFIAGILLWVVGQSLGWLLVFSSICYCIGYAGAYRFGDHFIMDKIDEMILNEEMEDAFVLDMPSEKMKKVRWYGKKPTTETLRRKLVDEIVIDDDDDAAEAK